MKLISQNYFKVLANAMRFFLIKIIANRRACITQTQLAGSRSEASEHIIQLPGCMRQHGCRADLGCPCREMDRSDCISSEKTMDGRHPLPSMNGRDQPNTHVVPRAPQFHNSSQKRERERERGESKHNQTKNRAHKQTNKSGGQVPTPIKFPLSH